MKVAYGSFRLGHLWRGSFGSVKFGLAVEVFRGELRLGVAGRGKAVAER